MSFIIEGNDYLPPLSGGYLIISIDKKEFHIVSVPSPVLSADRHRDSVNENTDIIKDKEGNEFSITVLSSNIGVDWFIEVKTKSDEKELKKRIDVEYQANEF
ncbi:conserved hypothetical protein [Candidatus Magnetomoraceae bacterium gMMP-15]